VDLDNEKISLICCIWDAHPSPRATVEEWFKARMKKFYSDGSRKLVIY
jgi:hypothetical protein